MNKLEANLSLLAITFFAAMQYIFLASVPESVSTFAFLSVTNLLGLLFAVLFFKNELFRLNRKQVLQSILLSGELFGFNLFLLMGSSRMDATTVSCVITMYFVFVPVAMLVMREKVGRNTVAGVVLVLLGAFYVMGADLRNMMNIHVLFLIAADLFFAAYIVTVDRLCAKSSPSILALGQMFFGFLISFVAWCAESLLTGMPLRLPREPAFWTSVIFISLFIRGLYGIVQIYAQRYVSAVNTSLIFSTEIVITFLLSPFFAARMGLPVTPIAPAKLFGCLILIAGVLTADGSLLPLLKARRAGGKKAGKDRSAASKRTGDGS